MTAVAKAIVKQDTQTREYHKIHFVIKYYAHVGFSTSTTTKALCNLFTKEEINHFFRSEEMLTIFRKRRQVKKMHRLHMNCQAYRILRAVGLEK